MRLLNKSERHTKIAFTVCKASLGKSIVEGLYSRSLQRVLDCCRSFTDVQDLRLLFHPFFTR